MRLFNFHIPEDLYEYLKKRAKEEYTNMTQYIIKLIVKDKKENYENKNMHKM